MAQPVGRPKGDVETEMLAVRIPVDLGQQLNRHLDRLETRTGIRANRASIARHALKLFLDAEDQTEDQRKTRPGPQRSATPARDNTRQPISPPTRNKIVQSGNEPGPTFDATKYTLGKLCPRGHAHGTTGQSLLSRSSHTCKECKNEDTRKRRQAKRQT